MVVRQGGARLGGVGFLYQGWLTAPVLDEGTQDPQEGVEVHDDEPDMDDALAGAGELGHEPLEGAFAFGIAKFAFDGDAVGFVLAVLLFFC